MLSLLDGGIGVVRRKQKSLREVLLLLKSKLNLSDNQMTIILNIFHDERPEMDYQNLPRVGKNLSKRLRTYMQGHAHIRRVQDGLMVTDQPPYNGYQDGAPNRRKKRKITREGDVADFSMQESLFKYGPGMVHAAKHRRLLLRLNAAYPRLLSPALLKTADEAQYNKEKMNGTLSLRPAMNYFALKLHADGVQIAKNGRKPQAIPILAAIDSIAPYDPVNKEVDMQSAVRIPYRHVRPFIVSFYHGSKKPDQFEFLREFRKQLEFLDPYSDVVVGAERLCTVQLYCVICDSPMKAWLTGKLVSVKNIFLFIQLFS